MPTIVEVNLYVYKRSDHLQGKYPIHTYPDFGAIVDDGWMID